MSTFLKKVTILMTVSPPTYSKLGEFVILGWSELQRQQDRVVPDFSEVCIFVNNLLKKENLREIAKKKFQRICEKFFFMLHLTDDLGGCLE